MKKKSISVTLGRTLNTGNYQSFKVEVTETIDLEDGDDPAEEYSALVKSVHTNMNNTAQRMLERYRKKSDDK